MAQKKGEGVKEIARNKKARHEYELLDKFEAGLALVGPEVKSLRDGKVSFKDGYVTLSHGEAWLVGVHIAPYANAGYAAPDPERRRKLLLNKRELHVLITKTEQKGLTVVPVRMYFKKGRIKLEIALARGKQTFDKRDSIKKRDIERDTAREMRRFS